MTTLGKILVLVNLVFSLIVGALIIMVFVARTNWADNYKKIDERLKVANANTTAYAQEVDTVRKEGKDETARVQEQLQKVVAELTKEKQDHAAAMGKLNQQMQREQVAGATLTGATEETKRRQDEIKKIEEQLNQALKENQALVLQKNELRDIATAKEIESTSLKARNSGLVSQIEDLSKQLTRIKANGGTLAGSNGTRNPPPEHVEGLIKTVDASGLLTLTIGSDAGLSEGNTLEVFSTNPAKYKGTIKILSVRANEAVAKPVGRPLGQIQVGDTVASKILGS